MVVLNELFPNLLFTFLSFTQFSVPSNRDGDLHAFPYLFQLEFDFFIGVSLFGFFLSFWIFFADDGINQIFGLYNMTKFDDIFDTQKVQIECTFLLNNFILMGSFIFICFSSFVRRLYFKLFLNILSFLFYLISYGLQFE